MGGMRPMLATPADPERGLPQDGERWAYEVKWDGMRVLADLHDGEVRLHSRTERDITVSFPELAGLGAAHPDVLLDGEIVVLAEGIPSFAALADRIHIRDGRPGRRAGQSGPGVPDRLRRAAAGRRRPDRPALAGPPGGPRTTGCRRCPMAALAGPRQNLDSLLSATLEHGLEGVVAKRRTSPYRPGVRSPDWLKLAHRRTQSCVVGGWRPETTSATRIGALLLGVWTDSLTEPGRRHLRFAGRVGSGGLGRRRSADRPAPAVRSAGAGPLAVRRCDPTQGRRRNALGAAERGDRGPASGPDRQRPAPPAGVPRGSGRTSKPTTSGTSELTKAGGRRGRAGAVRRG